MPITAICHDVHRTYEGRFENAAVALKWAKALAASKVFAITKIELRCGARLLYSCTFTGSDPVVWVNGRRKDRKPEWLKEPSKEKPCCTLPI